MGCYYHYCHGFTTLAGIEKRAFHFFTLKYTSTHGLSISFSYHQYHGNESCIDYQPPHWRSFKSSLIRLAPLRKMLTFPPLLSVDLTSIPCKSLKTPVPAKPVFRNRGSQPCPATWRGTSRYYRPCTYLCPRHRSLQIPWGGRGTILELARHCWTREATDPRDSSARVSASGKRCRCWAALSLPSHGAFSVLALFALRCMRRDMA